MIVVNGCKQAHVLEVTVVRGTTLLTNEGATLSQKGKPSQEGKEEKGDPFPEDAQQGHKAQLGARHVAPLVVVGLGTLAVQRGKAEEEATLAERLQDPLQEAAQRAPLPLALCARIIFWEM